MHTSARVEMRTTNTHSCNDHQPRSVLASTAHHASRFVSDPGAGLTLKSEAGFYETKRLVSYEPTKMKSLAAIVYQRQLTLFASPQTWIYQACWLVSALTLALVLTYCDEGQKHSKEALHLFEGAMLEFRALSAFVVSGFILLVVSSWRERRNNYAKLFSSAKELLLTITVALPMSNTADDALGREIVEVRKELGRWVLAAFELIVMKARGQSESEAARLYLEGYECYVTSGADVPLAMLLPGEWESLQPEDRHTSCFLWIKLRCKLLCARGIISTSENEMIQAAIALMRQEGTDLMARLETDLPYPYANVIGYLTQVVIFLQVVKNALSCAVLYPPNPPSTSLLSPLGNFSSFGSLSAEPELLAEPEGEAEPGLRAASIASAESEPMAEAEQTPEAEPEGGGRLLSEVAPEPVSVFSGWHNQAHMWALQLGCMLLWILTYYSFYNIHSELHNP